MVLFERGKGMVYFSFRHMVIYLFLNYQIVSKAVRWTYHAVGCFYLIAVYAVRNLSDKDILLEITLYYIS